MYLLRELEKLEFSITDSIRKKITEIEQNIKKQRDNEIDFIRNRVENIINKKISSEFFDSLNVFKIVETIKDYSPELLNEFFVKFEEGKIIDTRKILEKKNGNILDISDRRFENVIRQTVNMKCSNKTRGSLGSGELLFVLLGNAEKPKKGDIIINNKFFELKSSKVSNKKLSGGRFSCSNMHKANVAYSIFEKCVRKYFRYRGCCKKFSFSIKGINCLNNEVLLGGNTHKEKTVDFLSEVFTEALKIKVHSRRMLKNCVDNNGLIKCNKGLNSEIFVTLVVFNFIDYANSEKFDYMLLLNTDTLNFYVVSSEKDLLKLFKEGKVRVANGISWNDSQNQTSVQIYST